MEENYFKLLDYQEKLQKTGEYLSLEKEKELLNYESQISDHLRWKKKNHFIEVMVDFDPYRDCFYEIDYQIQEYKEKLKSDFEKLRAFEPDPRSKGFAILIKNLENFFEKEYTRQSAGLYLDIFIGSNVFIEFDPSLGLGKTVTYALKVLKSALRAY